MSVLCRARTSHHPLGRLALVPMGMLVVCVDALALSRPAVPMHSRVGTYSLPRRALLSQRHALVEMKEPIGLDADEVVEGTPGFDMKQHYEEHYDKERCPLFRNWKTYAASLPVRRFEGPHFRLHNLQHWSNPRDIDEMARQLLRRKPSEEDIRGLVKYVSAPRASGKTKSVLPAFLAGRKRPDGFTHYLYLACDNNNGRNFKLASGHPHQRLGVAKKQGAAFMVKCLQTLLERPVEDGKNDGEDDEDDAWTAYEIPVSNNPSSEKKTRDTIEKLLLKNLGPEYKVLIHVDEHCKMCPGTNSGKSDAAESGAAFSRGAMSALASVEGVTVVATYTERVDLPASQSSAVCRDPIMLPPIDPGIIMAVIPELRFENPPSPEDEFYLRCQWATLRLRLAFYVQSSCLGRLHARICKIPATDPEFEAFLAQFQSSAMVGMTHIGKRLRECNSLCAGKLKDVLKKSSTKEVSHISLMLVGVDDEDESNDEIFTDVSRQIADIIVLEDGRLSVSLKKLLSSSDPDIDLYQNGANLLVTRLVNEMDMLQGTPLENAYAWPLACRAAVQKELKFFTGDSGKFKVKGTDLQAGRLFTANNESNFNLTSLQPDVIYYVSGSKNTRGTPTHPIADIFFRTTDDHVVLIDVAGSNGTDVQKGEKGVKREKGKKHEKGRKHKKGKKRKTGGSVDRVAAKEEKLVNTTFEMQTMMEDMEGHRGLTVHGVVLAPFDERPSTEQRSSKGNRVMVVRGDDALRLLGGLRQLSRWLQ